MNRHEIHLLQQIKGYPALSITLPTHRTSPDNQQDPIRVKKMVDQAVERLLKEFTKREIAPLLEHLDKLVAGIDYRHLLDGLALFANVDFARAVQLPFTLTEKINIGETFLTRDLVFAMNRTPRYWVLVLSEKPTRLYEATRANLVEIREGGFPVTHAGPGGEESLPGGFGIKKSAYRDEYHRQFFRQVDELLKPYLADDPLPLLLVGVDRFLSFFKEVSDHKEAILATLQGSHDKTSPHELGELVWEVARQALADKRNQVLQELEEAVGERKTASGIGEVWRMAKDGRGHLLLVENDFHFPAKVDESGRHLVPVEDGSTTDVIDDAVDDIIETVLDKKGRVVFLENDELKTHQHIALLLRY